MAATEPITTAEQLFQAPDLGRCELLRGELIMMSPAGSEHGMIVAEVAGILRDFIKPRALGVVLGAETGFRVSSNPDTVLAPDVAFIKWIASVAGLPKGYFPGCARSGGRGAFAQRSRRRSARQGTRLARRRLHIRLGRRSEDADRYGLRRRSQGRDSHFGRHVDRRRAAARLQRARGRNLHHVAGTRTRADCIDDLRSFEQTPAGLRDWFVQHGLPAYRAGQVRKWLFQKRAAGFDEMTDLPVALREQLAAEFQIWTTQVAKHRQSADGSEKLLLELGDAQRIECVLLRDDKEHCTACISTQVGCAMGCAFCATGIDGFVRNLTAGEIIEQMLQLQRLWPRREADIPSAAVTREFLSVTDHPARRRRTPFYG